MIYNVKQQFKFKGITIYPYNRVKIEGNYLQVIPLLTETPFKYLHGTNFKLTLADMKTIKKYIK